MGVRGKHNDQMNAMFDTRGKESENYQRNLLQSLEANKKKYDELMAQRKKMFQNVLPLFEKAYEIKPSDENTKNILKLAYEIIGQPEKAKSMN